MPIDIWDHPNLTTQTRRERERERG